MTVQELKLGAIDLEITDAQFEKLFLNTDVTSEEDIREVVAILQRYRPNLVAAFSARTGKIKKGIYRHFKGRDYLVLGEALHSETQEILVIYVPLYGEFRLVVRPKAMFLEGVDKPEYNYKGSRFRYISES